MKLSIVSYLDPVASAQVRAIQQELNHVTGSFAALNSWQPHVTIGDGIEIDEQNMPALEMAFRTIATNTKPFELQLDSIGTMTDWQAGSAEIASPFVIYGTIVVSEPLLQLVDLVAQITKNQEKWYHVPKPYRPHCTLAFRDLTEDGFHHGIAYLKDHPLFIHATIDHISLVEKLPELDREYARLPF